MDYRSRSFGGGFGGMDRISTTSRLDNSQKPGTAFIFDIIVVRVDVPTETFDDPNSLTVDVRFNNVDLKITSSRINVVEFRSGRSYEFNATPLELKEDLKRNPLKLELKNGGKLIGKGEIPWPESFISRINDCAGELTNCDESELKNSEGVKIGCIEVIIRLQTKCKEYTDPDYSLSQMPESICKQMDKVIDPNDILFVVGEDKNSCSCAQVGIIPASDSDKSLNPTCLDLSNFRNVNGKTLTSPDILATLNTTNCSQMQKVAHQYQELMGGTTAGCKDPSQPCCSFKKQPTCGALQNRRPFPNFSSSESNVIPCRCRSDDEAFAGQNVFRISGNEPVPDMMQTTINKPRCCPVCKENLSWLPKLAACPRCGYKAVPICEETPFNEKLTADDILKDFLEKKSSCTDESSTRIEEEEKTECRCTCKGGKLCAHCRIRKLCEDIFQPPVEKNENCNKCERKSSELYNICQTGVNDCRPYLARVFSELRDLYDIKDAKHKKNDKNERCEKHLNETTIFKKQQTKSAKTAKGGKGVGSDVNANAANEGANANEETVEERKKELYKQLRKERRRKKKEFEAERKKFLVKNFKKSHSACKGKAYTYGIVRKNPVSKIGHKTCINGFAAGRKNVPSNMGWLWNLEAKGSRAGWKPGAIRKPIKQLMKYFLRDFPADTIRVSQYAYRKKAEDKDEPELIQKPTLHIFKKNGEYTITLRPLKDAEALKQCADPYLDMKPIQFKIIKNPLILEMRKLKRCLKDMGFSKCTCHKPIIYCYCRSFLDKKRLEYQCNKESRKLCLPNVADQLVLSDTTDSDVEFDFGVTPPAGVIKPDRLKKPDLINHGTQYVEGDWNVPPMYPREPNKYMKLYNCAIGERFGKAYGPYGEDGYAAGATPNACGPGGGGAGGGKGGRGGGKGGPGGRGGKGGTDFLRQKGGGKGGRGGAGGDGGDVGEDGKGGKAGGGKVDMLKYLQQKTKDSRKDGKKKGRRVSEMPPPLLCMIDRRGKPYDPCAPCLPCGPCCDGVCCYPRCDPRIC